MGGPACSANAGVNTEERLVLPDVVVRVVGVGGEDREDGVVGVAVLRGTQGVGAVADRE